MIAKLTGKVDSLGPDWAIVDVNGVGYHVGCSRRTLAALGPVGNTVKVLIETRLRDELPYLYGFADASERDWFRLLNTVQGVGAKVALSILSVLPPEKLMLAIAAQDKAAISQADGVGPKLATRLLSELKDKTGTLGTVTFDAPTGITETGGLTGDAVSALVNLGYGRSEALVTVSKLKRDDDTLGDLIKRSLKEMGG
jgi:Holliday junction DNA helicase RuvA